jgi:hypothetical protein
MPFAGSPIATSVGFHVTDPSVLRRLFLFLRDMEQNVESAEVGILVDDGLRLLVLDRIQFMNRVNEVAQELELLPAERNIGRPNRPKSINVRHFQRSQHSAIFTRSDAKQGRFQSIGGNISRS